jgi:hypothetical protein
MSIGKRRIESQGLRGRRPRLGRTFLRRKGADDVANVVRVGKTSISLPIGGIGGDGLLE